LSQDTLCDDVEVYRIPVHEALEIAIRCREMPRVQFLVWQSEGILISNFTTFYSNERTFPLLANTSNGRGISRYGHWSNIVFVIVLLDGSRCDVVLRFLWRPAADAFPEDRRVLVGRVETCGLSRRRRSEVLVRLLNHTTSFRCENARFYAPGSSSFNTSIHASPPSSSAPHHLRDAQHIHSNPITAAASDALSLVTFLRSTDIIHFFAAWTW
jgi:hypothetical protein